MGITNQGAFFPYCFAQWRKQGSYVPWDWKEAAAWITAFPTASSSSKCWDTSCNRTSLLSVTSRSLGRGRTSQERAMSVPQTSHAVVLTLRTVPWAAGEGNRVGCGLGSHNSEASVSQLKRAVQLGQTGPSHLLDSKGSVSQEECIGKAPCISVWGVSWGFSLGNFNRSVGSNFRWETGSGTGQIHRGMNATAKHCLTLHLFPTNKETKIWFVVLVI